MGELDRGINVVVLRFLTEQVQLHREVLPPATLAIGFPFDGMRGVIPGDMVY